MAQSSARPQLVQPRTVSPLEAAIAATGGTFDVDAFHVMDRRDDQLVAEELLHGAMTAEFGYTLEISGKQQFGISVVGARHCAAKHGGLHFNLIADQHKVGTRLVAMPYSTCIPTIVTDPSFAEDPDYYSVVGELIDIKTGNRLQEIQREARFESRRDGSLYERPKYQAIAVAKLYRNLVLHIIPQDVLIQFRDEVLKLKKGAGITGSVLDEKRGNVLRFASQKGIAIDRHAVDALTLDQIAGLGDAAREGQEPAFYRAAEALGLIRSAGHDDGDPPRDPPPAAPAARRRGRQARSEAQGTPPSTVDPRASDDTPPPAPAAPTPSPAPEASDNRARRLQWD